MMKKSRIGLPKGARDEGQPLSQHIVALVFENRPPEQEQALTSCSTTRRATDATRTEMQLGQGEAISDTARVLSRYVDLIMLRTFESQTLYEMAEYSTVPVINGLTNESHPCQIMADIMTFEEKRGSIKIKRLFGSVTGNNVFNSFLQAAEKFNFSLVFQIDQKN